MSANKKNDNSKSEKPAIGGGVPAASADDEMRDAVVNTFNAKSIVDATGKSTTTHPIEDNVANASLFHMAIGNTLITMDDITHSLDQQFNTTFSHLDGDDHHKTELVKANKLLREAVLHGNKMHMDKSKAKDSENETLKKRLAKKTTALEIVSEEKKKMKAELDALQSQDRGESKEVRQLKAQLREKEEEFDKYKKNDEREVKRVHRDMDNAAVEVEKAKKCMDEAMKHMKKKDERK